MSTAVPFSIHVPLTFFEKSEAAPGKKKRFAGVVSTDKKDKERENVIQDGLDYGPFVKSGWFNDNHDKTPAGILGYPDGEPKKFRKGERLPDGTTATHNCTWAEGYLLDGVQKAERIWEIGQALAKSGTNRRLGFSLEGEVLERSGYDRKTVTKAVVRNIAITHVPIGEETRMEVFAKSETEARARMESDIDALAKSFAEIEKALTMGEPPADGKHVSELGPATGEGAGQVLTQESLEGAPTKVEDDEDEDEPLTKAQAIAAIRRRYADCDEHTAERAYSALLQMQQRQLLKGDTMSTKKKDGEQQLSGSDLKAQLDNLDAASKTPNRAAELFAKSQAGTITPEEHDELMKSISPGGKFQSATEPMRDTLQKSTVNVSPWITEVTRSLNTTMDNLADCLRKSQDDSDKFQGLLAPAIVSIGREVVAQGELLKSMKEQLDTFGAQPARAPKSQGAPKVEPLNKGAFNGGNGPETPEGVSLSVAQVTRVCADLMSKGQKEIAGENLINIGSKFESFRTMSPAVAKVIVEHHKSMTSQAA